MTTSTKIQTAFTLGKHPDTSMPVYDFEGMHKASAGQCTGKHVTDHATQYTFADSSLLIIGHRCGYVCNQEK